MGVPDLLKTAKLSLTTSTKLFGPTAPFGSGGAESTLKVPAGPVKPWPMPSKLRPGVGAAADPGDAWTTGSRPPASGNGVPALGSCTFLRLPEIGAGAMVRSGGEMSWCVATDVVFDFT